MDGSGAQGKLYRTLDAWRGVASLWVVCYHSGEVIAQRVPAVQSALFYQFWLQGFLGVPLFFVISGYCIANAAARAIGQETGAWRFALARGRRIYIPLWFSLLFYVGFGLAASILTARGLLKASNLAAMDLPHQSPLFYFANFTLTQVPLRQTFLSVVCWTLCYEIVFYLIVGLGILTVCRGSERRLLNALHALTLVTMMGLLVAPQRMGYPLDLWPHFGLGVLVYDLLAHADAKWSRALFGVVSVQMAAFVLRYDYPCGVLLQSSRALYLAAGLFALLLVALYRHDALLLRSRFVGPLMATGRFSYSLYLIHFLVIGIVIQGLAKAGIIQRLHLLCWLALVAASLGAGYLFYLAFERRFMRARR